MSYSSSSTRLKSIPLDTTLQWITFINHGYIDYAKNFFKCMEKANIQMKLIVFCADKQSVEELEALHNENCICILADFLEKSLPADLKRWGNKEYKQIVFTKLDIILYALQNTYDLGVKAIGYIDTDIALFMNPRIPFLYYMDKQPDISIFSQCDEAKPGCTNIECCPNICSGVIVFRNKKELYQVFEYKEAVLNNYLGDQDFLRAALLKASIPFVTLDKNILPNGCFFPELKQKKIKFPKWCCLIHFNYMIGHDKKKAMQLQELWYV